MGQDQVSGGVSVPCWLAAPVAMFYGNLPEFGNKVKIGNNVQFGDRFKNWCNVWSVKGVTVDDHVPECHVTFGRGWLHNVWWDPHIDRKPSWGTISNVPLHIPHEKLKSRLTHHTVLFSLNGSHRNNCLVLSHDDEYFTKAHWFQTRVYSKDDIISVLEFLVENIFVVLAGKVFKQRGSIYCSPLLAEIFLYSHELEFMDFALDGKEAIRVPDEQNRLQINVFMHWI